MSRPRNSAKGAQNLNKGAKKIGGLLPPDNSFVADESQAPSHSTERQQSSESGFEERRSQKRARLSNNERVSESTEGGEMSWQEKALGELERLQGKMVEARAELRKINGRLCDLEESERARGGPDKGKPSRYYLFLDLETNTCLGPNFEKMRILEIGYRMTDLNFVPLDEGERSIISWPTNLHREGMPQVVIDMHTKSRLLQDLASSNERINLQAAEQRAIRYLEKHSVFSGSKATMAGCGSSFDYRVLAAHMPKLAERFYYSVFDPSCLWYPVERLYSVKRPKGNSVAHRALDDVNYAIELSQKFLRHAFKPKNEFSWPDPLEIYTREPMRYNPHGL